MCFTPQKYRFDTAPSESAPEIQRDDFDKRNQRSFCFTHLTFGLLDGWWSYEDAELRIPGSPYISKIVGACAAFGRIQSGLFPC